MSETHSIKVPEWQPDESVTRCPCRVEFSVFKRRHHCRACGLVFCGECTQNKIFLPPPFTYTEPQRVCRQCNRKLRDQGLSERKPVGVNIGTNSTTTPVKNDTFDSHY